MLAYVKVEWCRREEVRDEENVVDSEVGIISVDVKHLPITGTPDAWVSPPPNLGQPPSSTSCAGASGCVMKCCLCRTISPWHLVALPGLGCTDRSVAYLYSRGPRMQ